jgi:hypothetical protein
MNRDVEHGVSSRELFASPVVANGDDHRRVWFWQFESFDDCDAKDSLVLWRVVEKGRGRTTARDENVGDHFGVTTRTDQIRRPL